MDLSLRSTVPLRRVSRIANKPIAGRQLPPAELASLENINEYAYLVQVTIGNQTFELIMDTASSDLWVVSASCQTQDCQGVPKYTNSSTLTVSSEAFNLGYLSGKVSGVVGYDDVSVNQFMISSQAFALATNTSSLGLASIEASGILGLAFPSEASIPSSTGRTTLENLFTALDPPSRFFSFHFSRTGQNSSTFSLGTLDPSIVHSPSDLTYTPVFSPDGQNYDYWKLPLLSLTLNSHLFNLTTPSKVPRAPSPIAVLDTGTTLILGPSKDVDAFWAAAGGARKESGTWQVMCGHSVMVGVVLGNESVHREYALDPADVSWNPEDGGEDGWCTGGIQSNDNVVSGDWLLGDVFLRNVYVTHHAANASSPPLIGLLNLTDPQAALDSFRMTRGMDSASVGPVPTQDAWVPLSSSGALTAAGGAIVGASAVASFILSASVLALAKIWMHKRFQTRSRAEFDAIIGKKNLYGKA